MPAGIGSGSNKQCGEQIPRSVCLLTGDFVGILRMLRFGHRNRPETGCRICRRHAILQNLRCCNRRDYDSWLKYSGQNHETPEGRKKVYEAYLICNHVAGDIQFNTNGEVICRIRTLHWRDNHLRGFLFAPRIRIL